MQMLLEEASNNNQFNIFVIIVNNEPKYNFDQIM